jgi:nucleoside phosphorylase
MAGNYGHPGLRYPSPVLDIYQFSDGSSIQRAPREEPEVHYGIIGSSNALIKSARYRDDSIERMAAEGNELKCIEMEAAGLMNNFPCLVVRGISNYADSSKNDDWQRYAAIAAAAVSKQYLTSLQAVDVEKSAPLSKIMDESE